MSQKAGCFFSFSLFFLFFFCIFCVHCVAVVNSNIDSQRTKGVSIQVLPTTVNVQRGEIKRFGQLQPQAFIFHLTFLLTYAKTRAGFTI